MACARIGRGIWSRNFWPAGGPATGCRWTRLWNSSPCYDVPLADSTGVVTEDAAVAAAARLGGPVALRADVPDLVRARGAGALLIDLHGADEVRRGFRSLSEAFGHRLAGVIVKPMVTGGVEVMISMLYDVVVGQLVLFGAGGAAADALADRAARLAPLTDYDADELIRSIRAAPLLLTHPDDLGVDLIALRDLVLRVAQMADDLPQIAELDLSPVLPARRRAIRRCQDRLRPPSPPTLTSAGCRDRPAIYSGPAAIADPGRCGRIRGRGDSGPDVASVCSSRNQSCATWSSPSSSPRTRYCPSGAHPPAPPRLVYSGYRCGFQPTLLQPAASVRENREHQPERARGSPETSAGWALAGTGSVG